MMADRFGHIAETYDSDFTNSPTGRYQRQRVWTFLKSDLPANPSKVLELNCGTGEDAVWLAKKKHHLLATDLSEAMVAVTKEKLNPYKQARAEVLDIKVVDRLKDQYDHVFSNFGGLNCLSPSNITDFGRNLYGQLTINGKLTVVVMGRKCVWERFYFSVKRDRLSKNRRLGQEAVSANVDGVEVPTWYYSPKEFSGLLGSNYRLIKQKPVGLFVPPSYLDPAFKKKGFLLKCLYQLERIFGNASFLANRADHFYLTFEKIA